MEKNKTAKKIPLHVILCGLACVCAVGLSVFLILSHARSARELADIRQQVRETQAVADQLNDVKTEVKTTRKHLEKNGEKGVTTDIKNNSKLIPQKEERIEKLTGEIKELEKKLAMFD